MTQEKFDKIVEERIQKIQTTLVEKGKGYVRNGNKMHNFDVGASITGHSREKVLYGFMLKHLISFQDMVNDIEAGDLPTEEYVDEKIGDIICYAILAEASIKDKLKNKERDERSFEDAKAYALFMEIPNAIDKMYTQHTTE